MNITTKLAAVGAALTLALGVGAAPAAAAPPAGPTTDRLNLTYSNSDYTSRYHLFAAGLDWSKPVGLMVYLDGSGAYGLKNPNSTYLLDADGNDGLVPLAKSRNMVLLTPIAPAPGCDYDGNSAPDTGENANCWYDGARGPRLAAGKNKWASDLVDAVKRDYPITSHTVVGGFSSGAQAVTQFFGPAHAEQHSVDLTVAIGYGGAPVTTPRYSDTYKARSAWAWDTGTADNAYRTDQYGSIGGYNWYRGNGFTRTAATWPRGVEHDRPGQFDTIMRREMDRFLTNPPINAGTPTPSPTRTPSATPTPTRTPSASPTATATPTPTPSPTTGPAEPIPAGVLPMENCRPEAGCERAEFEVLECRVPGDPRRPGKIGVRVDWNMLDRGTRTVQIERAQPDQFPWRGNTREHNNRVNTVAPATQPGYNMIYVNTQQAGTAPVRAVANIPTCR